MTIPAIFFPSTHGRAVDFDRLTEDRIIVYCYPRTGEPGKPFPVGCDAIPGARGCTPPSRSIRNNYRAIRKQDAEVFGLSTQGTDYQSEAAARLHLPFALFSDENLRFTDALLLPTFQVHEWTLIKRLTLVMHHQRVEKVSTRFFRPTNTATKLPLGCVINAAV